MIKNVWTGRDNDFILRFDATDKDGETLPADMSVVTDMLLELEGNASVSVVRNEADAPINWWDGGLDAGEARFTLGAVLSDAGVFAARLTLSSVSDPGGVVWASYSNGELSISVHSTGA